MNDDRNAEHQQEIGAQVGTAETVGEDTYDALLAAARKIGAEQGHAAASWVFDGNTNRETYATVLKGIEDGDPEILDSLPYPDLSGQWADEPTSGDVFLAICDEAKVDALSVQDAESEALDAYERAFVEAAHADVEAACHEQLNEGSISVVVAAALMSLVPFLLLVVFVAHLAGAVAGMTS